MTYSDKDLNTTAPRRHISCLASSRAHKQNRQPLEIAITGPGTLLPVRGPTPPFEVPELDLQSSTAADSETEPTLNDLPLGALGIGVLASLIVVAAVAACRDEDGGYRLSISIDFLLGRRPKHKEPTKPDPAQESTDELTSGEGTV